MTDLSSLVAGLPAKYELQDGPTRRIGDGVRVQPAVVRSGDLEVEVDLVVFDAVSESEAAESIGLFEHLRSLSIEAIAVPREAWHEDETLTVAVNRVEGELLTDWVAARPGRDPIGAIAVLIPLAAGLDQLHHDTDIVDGHRGVSGSTITVGFDQIAVTNIPPLPEALAARLDPAERGAPGAAADAKAIAGVITTILTGDEPAVSLPELRRQFVRFSGRPDLVDRIVQARDPAPERRPALLVNWLARLRGATVTPDEMDDVVVPDERPISSWRRQATQPLALAAIAAGIALLAIGAFFVGQRTADPVAAVGLQCDAAEQAAAASEASARIDIPFTWNDTDADCFHDSYEIHWMGTDYLVPDESDSTYPTPESQIRVLRNYYFDITQIRGLDPTACEPAVASELAGGFIERSGLEVSWADRDGDCLHDAYESNAAGTNPDVPDTDGDGQVDAVDIEIGAGGMLMPLDEQLLFVMSVHRRNHLDGDAVSDTDPVVCDAAAWQRAAVVYLQSSELPLDWVDEDGDCLHSTYEQVVTATDPAVADTDGDGIDDGNDLDSGDGMIEPLDRQFDVVRMQG